MTFGENKSNLLDHENGVEVNNIRTKTRRSTFKERYFSPIRAGSLRGNIFTLTSICFGSAGLSYPKALVNLGFTYGTLLFLVLAIVSYWSLYILLQTGLKNKIMSYGGLIKECLGNKMMMLSDINNIIFCYGIMMTYQFTISSFFIDIMKLLFHIEDTQSWKLGQMLISFLLIQLPLCLLKNVSKLQYASMVGCCSLLVSCVIILVECPFFYQEGRESGSKIEYVGHVDWSILESFSIILYSFSSHNALLGILSELKDPTPQRCHKVLNRSFMLEVIVFAVIGYGGFFSLLSHTPSIFIMRENLKSFSFDYFILIVKIMYFLTLHCSIAVNNNVLRGSIRTVLFKGNEIPFKLDFLITLIILSTSNLLTYLIKDVVQILGIIGGICVVIVCFISPIMSYVKSNVYERYHWKNICSILIMLIITIIGLMSAGYTIFSFINQPKINI